MFKDRLKRRCYHWDGRCSQDSFTIEDGERQSFERGKEKTPIRRAEEKNRLTYNIRAH